MLSVIMLNVILLSVIMSNVVKLSVVKLNVVVLNVMAPLEQIYLLDSRHVEVCDSFISEKELNENGFDNQKQTILSKWNSTLEKV